MLCEEQFYILQLKNLNHLFFVFFFIPLEHETLEREVIIILTHNRTVSWKSLQCVQAD